MSLDQAKLNAASRGFRAVFLRELGQEPGTWEQFTRRIPSRNKEEVFVWLQRAAGVREWIGDRILAKLRAFDYAIKNKKWENGLEVEADDIDDDNLAVYGDAIREMASDFNQHKQELQSRLSLAGFDASEGLAYDGQFFFDSDHVDGDNPPQSNVATFQLSENSFHQARMMMRRIRKPNGKRAHIRPTHIVISEELEPLAERLFLVRDFPTGGTNPLYKKVIPVVDPELEGSLAWYLYDLSKPLKPYAWLDRRPVRFRARTKPTDDPSFTRDVYEYGADARYNFGYWFWQVAWGSDGTTPAL